jgi:hypothetical protein
MTCNPAATNPELGCPATGVNTTCIHFDNAAIPPNVPAL